MNLKFTDIPVFVSPDTYSREIELMAVRLMDTGKVACVYQVGGVNNPGISDVDLYVVFKNGNTHTDNPVQGLQHPAGYLFSHRLFGTSENYATRLEQYTFFKSYKLIAGDPVPMTNYKHTENDVTILKHQIALEYLVKAYISISIQLAYNSIKLRGYLLHAKAVLYDFDFLGINDPEAVSQINRIIETRNNWFTKPANDKTLSESVFSYRDILIRSINESISKYKFYLPECTNKQIARNILIKNGNQLNVKKKGISVPSMITNSIPEIRKIANRLNKFEVTIPVSETEIPEILNKRAIFLKEAFSYNNQNYPGFICTGHGLNIF